MKMSNDPAFAPGMVRIATLTLARAVVNGVLHPAMVMHGSLVMLAANRLFLTAAMMSATALPTTTGCLSTPAGASELAR
jgi:hypothetical protein